MIRNFKIWEIFLIAEYSNFSYRHNNLRAIRYSIFLFNQVENRCASGSHITTCNKNIKTVSNKVKRERNLPILINSRKSINKSKENQK